MNLLEKIVETKRLALAQSKKLNPMSEIISQSKEVGDPASLLKAVKVKGELSIIAEMKKKSPSAGVILEDYAPAKIAGIYQRTGARAISVLTEERFFEGSPSHLKEVKTSSDLPVLRKDFIFDPYQVYETRAMGAACVLLIVSILDKILLAELLDLAREIKLDALVEIHDEREMDVALKAGSDLIGINNRDLKSLATDVEISFRMRKYIPEGVCVVSESGIGSPETISRLRRGWFQGALIGEAILKSKDMESRLRALVQAGISAQEAMNN